jgi:phosphoenolpyruvate carboxylase
MARRASDVLAVELLQKAARVPRPLRVVPLFETPLDLRASSEVLDRLFSTPAYRRRIEGRQEVMVGYSDSAKEAGRFTAGWELYKAQENVLSVARRHRSPSHCFTAGAAVSDAAAVPRTSRFSRSRQAPSMASCVSPSRAR